VKTVGFLSVLQPREDPKLTMPCTSQDPLSAWQFSGPPESPCIRAGRHQPRVSPEAHWEALSLVTVREAEDMCSEAALSLFSGALEWQASSWFAVQWCADDNPLCASVFLTARSPSLSLCERSVEDRSWDRVGGLETGWFLIVLDVWWLWSGSESPVQLVACGQTSMLPFYGH
jgi:hypothetical protein